MVNSELPIVNGQLLTDDRGKNVAQIDGRYRLDKQLGEGRLGTLYQAYDTRLARPVALRQLHPNWLGQTEKLTQLQQALRAAAALRHPHIGITYHIEWDTPQPYLVTELASYPAFSGKPGTGDDPLTRVLELTSALAYAHRQGVVHGGLFPGSILIKAWRNPRLIVLDWGAAAFVGVSAEQAIYSAPELRAGQPIDARADVYSLGALLYELLGGAPPQPNQITPLHEINPSVSNTLARLVMHLLLPDPAQRPASAEAVWAGLREAIDINQRLSHLAVAHTTEMRIWRGRVIERVEPVVRENLWVGADPQNDIVLTGSGVADRHVYLEQREGHWYVMDKGNQNVTYLNNQRLLPQGESWWFAEQPLAVGPYLLTWRNVWSEVETTTPIALAAQLVKSAVTLLVDQPVITQISLQNNETRVLAGTLNLTGAAAAWGQPTTLPVYLLPNGQSLVSFTWRYPAQEMIEAGDYPFQLQFAAEGQVLVVAEGKVNVPERFAAAFALRPTTINHRTPLQVKVQNKGNAPLVGQLSVHSAEMNLNIAGLPDILAISVHQTQVVPLNLSCRRPFIGSTQLNTFTVRFTFAGGHALNESGLFQNQPIIPTWIASLAMAGLLMVCVFTVLLWQLLR